MKFCLLDSYGKRSCTATWIIAARWQICSYFEKKRALKAVNDTALLVHSLGTLSVCACLVVRLCTCVGCQWTRMCLSLKLISAVLLLTLFRETVPLWSPTFCMESLRARESKSHMVESAAKLWWNFLCANFPTIYWPQYFPLETMCWRGRVLTVCGLRQTEWCHCLSSGLQDCTPHNFRDGGRVLDFTTKRNIRNAETERKWFIFYVSIDHW